MADTVNSLTRLINGAQRTVLLDDKKLKALELELGTEILTEALIAKLAGLDSQSAIDQAIADAVAAEALLRSDADADEVIARNLAISSAISTEVSNRNSAISTAVADEATARDLAISSAISTEVSNRNSAISTAVSAEAGLRSDADDALSDRINTLETVASSGMVFKGVLSVNTDWTTPLSDEHKKGDFYKIGADLTINAVGGDLVCHAGDMIIFLEADGPLTAPPVSILAKIDNTESADIIRDAQLGAGLKLVGVAGDAGRSWAVDDTVFASLANLSSGVSGKGASSIGVNATFWDPAITNVEQALQSISNLANSTNTELNDFKQELADPSDLAPGAGLVGFYNNNGSPQYSQAGTVQVVLAEINEFLGNVSGAGGAEFIPVDSYGFTYLENVSNIQEAFSLTDNIFGRIIAGGASDAFSIEKQADDLDAARAATLAAVGGAAIVGANSSAFVSGVSGDTVQEVLASIDSFIDDHAGQLEGINTTLGQFDEKFQALYGETTLVGACALSSTGVKILADKVSDYNVLGVADGSTLVKMGEVTLASVPGVIGQPVYLGSSGAIVATPPSAANEAVVVLGIKTSATTMDVRIQVVGIN